VKYIDGNIPDEEEQIKVHKVTHIEKSHYSFSYKISKKDKDEVIEIDFNVKFNKDTKYNGKLCSN
jgi:hypothetical protein